MTLSRSLRTGGSSQTFVDDVFAAHTFTGNASTQVINNGIDLTKGGLVWTKNRGVARNHLLYDTARGANNFLMSNDTAANSNTANTLTSFNSNGFTLGSVDNVNAFNGETGVSWTFRKAPKFFDVVTYTGNGTTQNVAHSLGQSVGMIITKRVANASPWYVWHKNLTATSGWYLRLNTTDSEQAAGGTQIFSSAPTTSTFTVGSDVNVNNSGETYVAYLFAHDTGTDGLIQCGSFTTDGSGNATVNLGWEPQYFIMKTASIAQDWYVTDTARGTNYTSTHWLQPNASSVESIFASSVRLTATGAGLNGWAASQTYIYLAIRRPNKPPTVGTQVYNAIARTGNNTINTEITGVGFAPDLLINRNPRNGVGVPAMWDRLRGLPNSYITTAAEAAQAGNNDLQAWGMDGIRAGTSSNSYLNAVGSEIDYFLKRATGVFDTVAFTCGTSTNRRLSHSLGVVPELIIMKVRSTAGSWWTYFGSINTYLALEQTAASTTRANSWGTSAPTISDFGLDETFLGSNLQTHVAYLFASRAGISKVFSYTGNGGTAGSAGSSQTIDCGFTTGARFVMLKCTSHASDWVIVDTVRGIIAANDPALSLNTTAAEVTTTDLLDPASVGFVVNQLATGTTSADFNVTGRTYIGLAFA